MLPGLGDALQCYSLIGRLAAHDERHNPDVGHAVDLP